MTDIAFVASTNFTGVGTTALTVALGAAWVAGNTGFISISLRSAAGTATVSTVTGGGGTWSKVKALTNSTPTVDVEIWSTAVGGTTLGTGITLTIGISGTTTETSACTGQWTNVSSITASSETTNTGTSAAPSVTLTTADVRGMVLGCFGSAFGVAMSATTGILRATADTGTTGAGVSVGLLESFNSGGVGASITVTAATGANSAAWAAIGIELQPTAPTLRLAAALPYTTPKMVGRIALTRPPQASMVIRSVSQIAPIPVPYPQSVLVTPSTTSIVAGNTQQLVAALLYSNSFMVTVTTSSSTSYHSNNTGVATVNSTGLITGVAVGSTTVVVTWEQIGVGTFTGSCTVTVTAALLVSIAVTPSNDVVLPSAVVNYTATGTYTDATTQNLTTSVTWASSNTAAATIVAGTGVATATSNPSSTSAPATTSISATLSAITGATVLIVEAAVLGIVVAPESFSLAKGLTQQMSAQATHSTGTVTDVTATVTWGSGTPADATVNSTGLVTSVAPGSSLISATLGTFSDSVTVTTTSASLVSIAVTPADVVVAPLGTQAYTATGTYSDGSMVNITGSVTWASSNTSIATISGGGLATATATSGVTVISATLGPVSGNTALIVEVIVAPTLVSIVPGPNVITMTFSAGVQNIQPVSAWSISTPAGPNVVAVTITSITYVGDVITINTTEQTGGAAYTLNVPSNAIFGLSGYPWLGPYAQAFTGVATSTPIISAVAVDAQTVDIIFARAVMLAGALNPANYVITPGPIAVLAVTQLSPNSFQLTTAPQSTGVSYTLTASNIIDDAFNPI